jgi:4'-phosphopantetheinyl transferase
MIQIIMSKIYCETIEIAFEDFQIKSENNSVIKLFNIKLSNYYQLVPELFEYLNETEQQRAQKYHFEKDTNRFIICRVLLKFILAHHTGINIYEINIEKDENKKPFLSNDKSLCFNISHAEDFAIIVVSHEAVGIDIEYKNIKFNFSEILPFSFSNLEIEAVLNATDKTNTFYKFWTRKEAIVKATGKGISDNLPQIPALDGLHSVASSVISNFKKLHVFSFNLDDNYVVSCAFSGENLNLNKLLIYNVEDFFKK